jgi:ABC-type bacteriocin/lantibiotic exporter with double-glycine peptidase domain
MHQVAALVEGVGSLTAGLAACTAFLAALAFFNSTAHGLEHALGEVMTRRAGERLATAPASFFWQRAPRALAALPRLPAGDAAAPWFAAVDLGLAGVLAAAMLTLAPPVAALPTVALGLSLATTALLLLRRGSALPDAMQRDAELVSPETGAITMLINNRCGGRDGELFAQLAGSHAMHAKRRRSGRRLAVGLDGARAALRLIALAGGLGLGAVGVAEGWTTGGAVVAIFAASLALDALTERIAGRLARVTASRATLIAWREQIEAPPPDAALARPAVSIPVTGELVFADVSVRPCASRPAVLTAFSCVVASGTHVAIEGPGGAGKTLLLRLACGLAAPEVGLITFGGQPIETASRLRPGLVGCIGRAPAFGRASLRETLGCGASRWSDRALQAVLDETRLWDAIAPRGGLDLILTPDAPELSGGQRARLGLARALLREPALLCLDATLDSVEADLQTTLLAALRRRGCTVLLVSHHQYLRAACDRRLSLPWSGGSCDAAR